MLFPSIFTLQLLELEKHSIGYCISKSCVPNYICFGNITLIIVSLSNYIFLFIDNVYFEYSDILLLKFIN